MFQFECQVWMPESIPVVVMPSAAVNIEIVKCLEHANPMFEMWLLSGCSFRLVVTFVTPQFSIIIVSVVTAQCVAEDSLLVDQVMLWMGFAMVCRWSEKGACG